MPCQYCDGDAFGTRRSKLNTAGAEFFGFAGYERLRRGVKGRGLEVLNQDWKEAFLFEKCPGCVVAVVAHGKA